MFIGRIDRVSLLPAIIVLFVVLLVFVVLFHEPKSCYPHERVCQKPVISYGYDDGMPTVITTYVNTSCDDIEATINACPWELG